MPRQAKLNITSKSSDRTPKTISKHERISGKPYNNKSTEIRYNIDFCYAERCGLNINNFREFLEQHIHKDDRDGTIRDYVKVTIDRYRGSIVVHVSNGVLFSKRFLRYKAKVFLLRMSKLGRVAIKETGKKLNAFEFCNPKSLAREENNVGSCN